MLGKLVMVLACGAWVGAMAVQIPTLNWQKRSDWLDVRSVGAKGDGKTDDTDAIARALLAQTDTEYGCGQPGHCGNATKTIYFPPGVYPISKQLTINHMYGGALLGHGAATTILWVGEKAPLVAGPEYAMLLDNGTSYFHFEGLTWDGAGKAATAVDHYSQTHYGTWMRHRNCAYQNFTQAGIRVGGGIYAHNGSWVHGHEKMATAEVSYRNCVFRNTTIGIALYSYNDLDQVVSGCHFEDNEIGIFTPHGNFYLYNSRFERSRMFDTYWGAPGSSARRVVSVNSTMFALMGAWCSAANVAKIEDCRIEGWRGATVGDGGWWDSIGPLPAVALAWRGPLRVIDTEFKSANSSTPAIASWTAQQSFAASGWPDNIENGTWAKVYITSGNTYDGPLLGMTEGDTNHNVPPGKLGPSKITPAWNPVRDWWPISSSVFDCKSMGALGNATIGSAANDDTAAIQKCIDAAAAAGNGAVAYLGPGSFVVRKSLNLAGSDFSVEGAGTSTYISMLPDTQANPAAANDTLFAVSDTDALNITLAEFWIVKPKGAPALVMKGSAVSNSTQAASGHSPRLLNVDRVICMDNSSTGFVLTGLAATDVFNGGMFGCTLNVVDNAGGTVFVAFHEGGQTRLSAPSHPFSGLVGQQYMGAGEDAFNIIIQDSCSYVMDNMYTESTFQNFHLSGKPTDTPGRVTISGVKEEQIPPSSEAGVLDGFVGNFTFAGAGWGPGYGPDLTMSVRQTGSANVLLLGNSYMEMIPTFTFSDRTKLNTLGNIIYFQGDKITPKMQSYCAQFGPPDAQCLLKDQGDSTALVLASGALDDIRQLGLVDLELNFKSTLPAIKTEDAMARLSAGSLRINVTEVGPACLLPQFQILADYPGEECIGWPHLNNSAAATRPWNQSTACADPLVPKDVCNSPVLNVNPSTAGDGSVVSRSMPYLLFDQYGTERKPTDVPTIRLEDDHLRIDITPQWGGKVYSMTHVETGRELLHSPSVHQPITASVLNAQVDGGIEWNYSPGRLGHWVGTEQDVWAAKLQTKRGPAVRVWEFDRFNETWFQVDLMVVNGTLFAHPKIFNEGDTDVSAYWWTCVGMQLKANNQNCKPSKGNRGTRVLTPAAYDVGDSLHSTPWPMFPNATNGAPVDRSWLDSWTQGGDNFLRILQPEQPFIAVIDRDVFGNAVGLYHGHPLNGTKFWTGGSDRGSQRWYFWKDAPASPNGDGTNGGGCGDCGCFFEPQVGNGPTQARGGSHPFTPSGKLDAHSSQEWTEYWRTMDSLGAKDSTLFGEKESDAVAAVREWAQEDPAISKAVRQDMETFLEELADQPVSKSDLLHVGHPYGALHSKLSAKTGAKTPASLHFHVDKQYDDEVRPWQELLENESFSPTTLARPIPLSYMVSPKWAELLERSAAVHGETWLHLLYMSAVAAERLDTPRALALAKKSVIMNQTAVGYRQIAVLMPNSIDPSPRIQAYDQAWKCALAGGSCHPDADSDPSGETLQWQLAGEYALFLNTFKQWHLLRSLVESLPSVPACAKRGKYCDNQMVAQSQVMLLNSTGSAADCKEMRRLLETWVFTNGYLAGMVYSRSPTYDSRNYVPMWNRCLTVEATAKRGRPPTKAEQQALEAAHPAPSWIQPSNWVPPSPKLMHKSDDQAATVLGMRLPPPVERPHYVAQGTNIPTLNLLPKSDWLNVKKCCGAQGDGKTDDVDAIQRAIDMLTDTPYGCNIPGQCSNATKTLYFPPGTYAISRTLVIAGLNGMYAGRVIGHGAATTILWIGPATESDATWDVSKDPQPPAECAHTMWLDNGTTYFHYEGLTWDGAGKAAVGIDHYSHRNYGTFMLHRSEAFLGFNISGIRIGGSNGFGEKMATAEIRYQNCHFSSCRNGIMPQSYNDLDNVIEGCHFEDCDVGVNTGGHGNFYLRNSRFERSTQTDVIVAATSATIRRVVSVNSTAFLRSGCCSAAAPIRVEDCRIHQNRSLPWLVDPVPAIGESWRGPLQIVDTTFTPTLEEVCEEDPTCAKYPSMDFIDNTTLWDIDTGETFSSDQFRNYTDPMICKAECLNATGCQAWTYMKVHYINDGNGGVCIMFTQLTKVYKQGKLVPRTKPLGPYPGCNLYSYPCASGFFDSPMADSWTSGWEQTVLMSNNRFGRDGSRILGETGGKTGNRALVIPHTMTELGASDLNLDSQFLKSSWPTVTNLFDAKTMGAKGDGATDDSKAVQATVDAAASAGHGASAYFGPGRYLIKQPISITHGTNFTIEGSGTSTYFVWSGPASNDSVFAVGAVSSVTIQEFWVAKGIHQPMLHVVPGTAAPRMVLIDRLLSMDGGPNNYTDILLEGLSSADTVNIGQIVCDLAIIDSSPAVTLVAMNEGGTTTVASSSPGRSPTHKPLRREDNVPDANGFHGELTKIASGNPYDLIVRDSQSYVIGDQYTESTMRNILLQGAGERHTGPTGRVTVSGIKLENDGDRTIMVIDGFNGNFSHSSSEWWKPASGPFIVTQSGGGKMEMTFYGEAFDSQVPVFDVEKSTKLYFAGNLISFSGGKQDAATAAFCEKATGSTNKDDCVYPDQLEPDGLSRVSAAMDHLRLLGRWDLYLNCPGAIAGDGAAAAAAWAARRVDDVD